VAPYGKGSDEPADAPPVACMYQSHSPDDEWVKFDDSEQIFNDAVNVPELELPGSSGGTGTCPGQPA